jgi:hypothetical protein
MKSAFASLMLLITAVAPTAVSAADDNATDSKSFDYMPKIHGTLRTRYELATEGTVMSRFQVRNARISVSGNAAPFIDYILQTDLDDRGEYKFLDAWGRVAITPQVKVTIGQMRVPFSVDASRAPHQYYFTNRSTIGKLVGLQRSVGGKIAVATKNNALTAEIGAFNTHSITMHNVWERTMAVGAKARYTFGNMFAEVGYESARPDSVRINQYDAALHWSCGPWMVEGEYLYKHYTQQNFDATHAWNIMADYSMPIKTNTFNRLSFQARYDGITDNSQGTRGSDGLLYVSQSRFQRATIGATLSYVHPKLRDDVHLNYENYFYPSAATAPADNTDKIALELVVRF